MRPFGKFFGTDPSIGMREAAQGNFVLSEQAVLKMEDLIGRIHSNQTYTPENKKAAEELRIFLRTIKNARHLNPHQVEKIKTCLSKMGLDEAGVEKVFLVKKK